MKSFKIMKVLLAVMTVFLLIACGNKKQAASSETSISQSNDGLTSSRAKSQETVKMVSFNSEDLDGNAVTEKIFAEKDLTVVNIWGTFCGPCIQEMPELAAWAKEMPDNVQLIGLVEDINGVNDTEHIKLARQVLKEADANFLNIIAGTEDFYDILVSLIGVPTTIFVDKNGNIVGRPIIGANVDGYKKFVEQYLNEL